MEAIKNLSFQHITTTIVMLKEEIEKQSIILEQKKMWLSEYQGEIDRRAMEVAIKNYHDRMNALQAERKAQKEQYYHNSNCDFTNCLQ